MSMTGKTTNELFNIGTSSDIFSLYDFNVNFEKADNLIKSLMESTGDNAGNIKELQTVLEELKLNVTTLSGSVGTNATNIVNLQNTLSGIGELSEEVEEIKTRLTVHERVVFDNVTITLESGEYRPVVIGKAPESGLYYVDVFCMFDANKNGYRRFGIYGNTGYYQIPANVNMPTKLSSIALLYLSKDAEIKVGVAHGADTALNCNLQGVFKRIF